MASDDSTVNDHQNKKSRMERELQDCISQALKTDAKIPVTGARLVMINKEMNLFQGGDARGRYLQFAYDVLRSIPPSSMESERAFSSASYLCNKVRSTLNDDTLNALCILRSHFQTEQSP